MADDTVEQARQAVIGEHEYSSSPPLPADEVFLSKLDALIAAVRAEKDAEIENMAATFRASAEGLQRQLADAYAALVAYRKLHTPPS